MINIVRNVGGDEETMDYLNAFMAVVEVPVMLLFSRFSKGRRVSVLLHVSVAMFLCKALAFAFAPSIGTLFAATLLQAPSFALYTSAIVPYVSAVIAEENAAKAQSLAFSMTTLGASEPASSAACSITTPVLARPSLPLPRSVPSASSSVCSASSRLPGCRRKEDDPYPREMTSMQGSGLLDRFTFLFPGETGQFLQKWSGRLHRRFA